MARSFFLGTDAELYTGSENFSTLLTASPVSYGVSVGAAADYAAKNTAWRAAYEAAITPETRTKAKVAAKNNQKAIIKAAASALAKIIDGGAATDEQKIELGLNVRAIPSARPAPGQPNAFKASLVPGEAALEITWKCSNPAGTQGTIYQVYRQTTPGQWIHLGDAGVRNFLDATVPANMSQVTYKVRGLRSTVAGAWGTFVVTFGMTESTAATTTSVTEPAPKLAA